MDRSMLIGCALFLVPFAAHSHGTKEAMFSDLESIRHSFTIDYAPAEWKARHFGWNLNEAIGHVQNCILECNNPTVKDYQVFLKQFFRSTKDYHVSPSFYCTEAAYLPFSIKGAEGRFFIVDIESEHLSSAIYPIQIGDELLAIDGRPASDVVLELQREEFGTTCEGTDRSLAEYLFSRREGAKGHRVPQGSVVIAVKSINDGQVSEYNLHWNYEPERISSNVDFSFPVEKRVVDRLLEKNMRVGICEKKGSSPFDMAAWKSFIPDLGPKIWECDPWSPYYSYIFENEAGEPVGYLRIPSYDGDGYEISQLITIMQHLEENTTALVIDQVNNPGGSVFYLYTIASLLATKPLITPRHHYKITQADVAEAIDIIPELQQCDSDEEAIAVIGDDISGFPVNHQLVEAILSYYRFLEEEWKKGHTFTHGFHLLGLDKINGHHKARYTKPILFIVNELDFSGADFLPAILQDNHRVTIFGTKTAGAGGLVIKNHYPSILGVRGYSYTASIAERANGDPIENLGVTPDIVYSLTAEDIQHGFEGYREAVLKALPEAF